MKRTDEVFGISPTILPDSYVDRGDLDAELATLLGRKVHVAIRGESKCGKSWLRQNSPQDALVVQCRLSKTATDIYVDALSQLGIRLAIESKSGTEFKGRLEAEGEIGVKFLAKLVARIGGEATKSGETTNKPVGRDITDLRFVAELIKDSGKRLVIEDFHYLSIAERKSFAFDLKALWDYGMFVTIVGIWSQSNMLLALNPDLSGRVEERSVTWSRADLEKVLAKGGSALGLQFMKPFVQHAVDISYGNVGILQSLTLRALDELGILAAQAVALDVSDASKLDSAALHYADQVSSLYQTFSRRVAHGIRTRKDSTGIYAHAMAVLLDASDEELVDGLHLDRIFDRAVLRQDRIQKGNLRTVLEKFDELQVDEEGRGLVLTYNPATSEVTVVDRQLFLYRKYCTVAWPWEQLLHER